MAHELPKRELSLSAQWSESYACSPSLNEYHEPLLRFSAISRPLSQFMSLVIPAILKVFKEWQGSATLKMGSIPNPSNTIIFGEKYKDSPHNHMDFYQGEGNDYEEINQSKHRASRTNKEDGGSNYAFVDGSVRFKKYGTTMNPENLWAVTEQWRPAPPMLQE